MKKAIVFFAYIIFILALDSCHAYMDLSGQMEYKAWQDKSHIYVLNLKTNQDSIIHFMDGYPGKMSNDEVVSVHLLKIELKHGTTDSIVFLKNKPVPRYFWKDGIRYRIVDYDHYSLTGVAYDTNRIPFSEISQMNIKKIDHDKTVILVIGCSIGYAGTAAGLLYLLFYLAFRDMTIW